MGGVPGRSPEVELEVAELEGLGNVARLEGEVGAGGVGADGDVEEERPAEGGGAEARRGAGGGVEIEEAEAPRPRAGGDLDGADLGAIGAALPRLT